jgi:RND family efflux transporter MFP subunit
MSRFLAAIRSRFGAVLLLTIGACGWIALVTRDAAAQKKGGLPPTNVVTAQVIQREVVEGQAFVGTVQPTRISEVGSAVDGRVIEYPINRGVRVAKGQPLAQLLTKQLEIELAGAEAELANRNASYDELKRGRAEEIDQAKARMAARDAEKKYAVNRLERWKKMKDKGAYTEDQIEEIWSAAVTASNNFNEAKIALELLEKGARAEVLAQWQAKIEVQKQEIERIKDQLDKHTIRAPFDGYVVAEHTEAGQWVAKGGVVATIAELDTVDVEIHVLETYVPNVRQGDEVRVEISSLPKENFIGRVAEIVPQADLRTRNFPVRVRLENKIVENQPLILAGMFARANLAVGRVANATLVPKDAVVLGGQSPVVFVSEITPGAKNGGPTPGKPATVRPVPVELGAAWEGQIQVTGAIKPGEWVVVQGNERLMPGQSVFVVREIEPTVPVKTAAKNGAER